MAAERTVLAMVSPVSSDEAMMVVPSMRPRTMSALRPRRRGMFRSPILRNTRLRTASAVSAPTETSRMMASHRDSGPAGTPKTRFITASYLLEPAGMGGTATRTS